MSRENLFFINLIDLLNYGGDGTRKYVEGENVLDASHILHCGLTSNTENKVNILCLVVKSSGIYDVPHEVKVEIKIENNMKTISGTCSCKGGLSGTCKHCIAVLIHITRTKKYEFEIATCTDTASSAYKFITYLNNKSPDWDTKIMKHLNDKFQGSASTAHGIKCEQKARECYEKKYGHKVTQSGLLVNPNIPWLGYSPDGIVLVKNIIIEIKCPVDGKKKTVMEVVSKCNWIGCTYGVYFVKPKHQYHCQVQLGMLITNTRSCDFIVYSSFDDSCLVMKVNYNEDLTKDYLRNLQFVYFKYMLRQVINVKEDACQREALKDITNCFLISGSFGILCRAIPISDDFLLQFGM